MAPDFTHFSGYTQIGDETGIRGSDQRQGGLPGNFNGIHQLFGLIHRRPFPKEV
jgi:hypothetical protein